MTSSPDDPIATNRAGHTGQRTKRIIPALDGSTDGSANVLNCVEGIQVIRFEQNRGSAVARSVGKRAAKGRFVVWTGVDMTYSLEDTPMQEMVGDRSHAVGATTSARVLSQ